MTADFLAPIANHLWQSTLFAAAAALLAALLKDYRPDTRHKIWLAASLKFLFPFSILASLGARVFESAPISTVPPVASAAIQIGEPFKIEPDPLLLGAGADSTTDWVVPVLTAVWVAGALFMLARWLRVWFAVRKSLRGAVPVEVDAPIRALATPAAIEPGVFGIFRPVLLLPQGILDYLTPAQLRAILAHELCHVRRRDNLTSGLQMLVESVFWFHPLVWWIGSRLIAERENACDEEVLRQGSDPYAYAEGILKVCRMYLESPLPCAAGVTGADLRQRIEGIMARRPALNLSTTRRAALAVAAACSVGAPVFLGVLKAAQAPAQGSGGNLSFDIASIRENKSGDGNSRFGPGPGGGIRAVNVNTMQLVTFAYDVKNFQVIDAPGWVMADRYDILAKPERPDGPTDPKTMTDRERMDQMNQMRVRTRGLLADRFQLAVRREKKELPYYALVLAKGGTKLTPSKTGEFSNQHMRNRRGSMEGERVTMMMLTNSLSNQLDRTVVDESGLSATYDFTLTWDPTGDDGGASLFSALQEQLGLKLESRKGPVDVLVIEKVSKPSEN